MSAPIAVWATAGATILLLTSCGPLRLVVGDDDVIWYTDFVRGFLRRLDPASGQVSEWQSPSGPKSEPYGIVLTKGALWYSESFAKPNTIVRFDPKTQEFQSWAIPGGEMNGYHGGSRPW